MIATLFVLTFWLYMLLSWIIGYCLVSGLLQRVIDALCLAMCYSHSVTAVSTTIEGQAYVGWTPALIIADCETAWNVERPQQTLLAEFRCLTATWVSFLLFAAWKISTTFDATAGKTFHYEKAYSLSGVTESYDRWLQKVCGSCWKGVG